MPETVFNATIRHARKINYRGQNISQFHSPLFLLLGAMYYLPYLARKHLLDCCRIQRSQFTNSTLQSSYDVVISKFPITRLPKNLISTFRQQGIYPDVHFVHKSITAVSISTSKILDLYENLYDNVLACSILSYFTRAEATSFPEQFISTLEDQKIKEYQTSQAFDKDQQLDYRCLDGQDTSMHLEIGKVPIRLAKKFAQGIRHILSTLDRNGWD